MSTRIAITTLLLAGLLCGGASGQEPIYGETYRPGFHYSPMRNWTNEENGLVYKDGLFHIFYQANPFNNQFGNQSWGHAVSTDLVNWENRPVAIPGEDGIMSYSGTCVVDVNNTSGLGTPGNPPLIAAYTGFNIISTIQDQRLAFSLDNGVTWTKFDGNPVLDIDSNEFRDPKVFWWDPGTPGVSGRWIMINAHGGQKRVSFWSSPDLISWTFESNFFGTSLPSEVGGWEVPDFFEMEVEGAPGVKKWVLVVGPSRGSPAGGNGVFYVVGSFDGSVFTPDQQPFVTPVWADYGRDFDGVLSWENAPNGRRIWTGIMNSYGASIPTKYWRGHFAFPRELRLKLIDNTPTLLQAPIAEISSIREQGIVLNNLPVFDGFDPLSGVPLAGDMLDIRMVIDPGTADFVTLRVRENDQGERTTIGYDVVKQEMFVDRTRSGRDDFNADVSSFDSVPVPLKNGLVELRVLVDRMSVEAFAGAPGEEGRGVISGLIFPEPESQGVSLFSFGGNATLVEFEASPLRSIWVPEPQPAPTEVIARWNMNSVPNFAGYNPIVVDQNIVFGEGGLLGTQDQIVELNEAADHLWQDSDLPNEVYPQSSETAPDAIYANGNTGGAGSFNASGYNGRTGALYFPVNRYGREFDFEDAFTVEMVFRTDGNRSNAGRMQLLLQGETSFRYGIIVNEAGPGTIRFAVNDKQGTIERVDATGRNYADGQWYALSAEYDPGVGVLRLSVGGIDGEVETVETPLSADFDGLPLNSPDGNMLIGREDSSPAGGANGEARTFLGLIDEVQISDGIVTSGSRLGKLFPACPADVNGDGTLTGADFNAWIAAFAAGDPAADQNADRAFTGADFNAFLANFADGCS